MMGFGVGLRIHSQMVSEMDLSGDLVLGVRLQQGANSLFRPPCVVDANPPVNTPLSRDGGLHYLEYLPF